MKKNFYVLAFLLTIVTNVFAGPPYPKSFNWIPGGVTKKDQKVQFPCNSFAAVAIAEDWYSLLYGTTPDMAEQHLYSQCGSSGPSTGLQPSIDFITNTGIVDENSMPYGNTVTDHAWGSLPYFADQLSINPSFPCFAPHQAFSTTLAPNFIYNIASYQLISFTTLYPTLNTIDRLKRILLNYGPIAINLNSHMAGKFHYSHNHAYLLFGWDNTAADGSGSTIWYFKDSWPANDTYDPSDEKWPDAVSKDTGDLISQISAGQFALMGGPYVLNPTKDGSGNIINEGVYQRTTSNNGSTWVKSSLTKVPVAETNLSSNNLAISINGKASTTPSQYIASSIPLSLENISQLDNCTVTWSYTADPATPSAAVSFTPSTGLTTSAACAGQGYVTIKAVVTLPNGIAQVVTRRVYSSIGIPYKVVKTMDQCIGTTRLIQYSVESLMNEALPSTITITTPWDFRPAPGPSYSTYYGTYGGIPNAVFNVNYPNLTTTTGYGLIVNLTDAGYNNLTGSSTNGGSAMPCGSHLMAAGSKTVYPNPAHTRITVSVANSLKSVNTYQMKLMDMNGKLILTRTVRGSTDIDVSKLAKGVYMVQFISSDKKEKPEVQKIVVN